MWVLGMQPGCHADPCTGTHLRMWSLAHNRFATIFATHPHIFCRAELIIRQCFDPDGVEASPDRGTGLSPLSEFTPEATSDAKASSQKRTMMKVIITQEVRVSSVQL
jgi:hypothetical protein